MADNIGLRARQRLDQSGLNSRRSEEELPKSCQEAWALLFLSSISEYFAHRYQCHHRHQLFSAASACGVEVSIDNRHQTRLGTARHRSGKTHDSPISTSHLLILKLPSAYHGGITRL